MRAVLSCVFFCFVLWLPAGAEESKGHVEKTNDELKQQEPKPDHLNAADLNAWRERLAREIAKRTLKLVLHHRYHIAGSVDLRYSVTRAGDIALHIDSDNSTNLGLLTPNVKTGLDHSQVLAFPPGARENVITSSTRFQAVEELSGQTRFRIDTTVADDPIHSASAR